MFAIYVTDLCDEFTALVDILEAAEGLCPCVNSYMNKFTVIPTLSSAVDKCVTEMLFINQLRLKCTVVSLNTNDIHLRFQRAQNL